MKACHAGGAPQSAPRRIAPETVYEVECQASAGIFQAISSPARTVHAGALLACTQRPPWLLSLHVFSRRRAPLALSWGRAAARKYVPAHHPARDDFAPGSEPQALPSAGVSRSGRQARTTVYPCGACHGPRHLLPCTPRASGTPTYPRAHPSNERRPCRSPGDRTAALSDSLGPTPATCCREAPGFQLRDLPLRCPRCP